MKYGGFPENRLLTYVLGDHFLFTIEFSFAKHISIPFGTKIEVQWLQVLANFSIGDREIKRELFVSGIMSEVLDFQTCIHETSPVTQCSEGRAASTNPSKYLLRMRKPSF